VGGNGILHSRSLRWVAGVGEFIGKIDSASGGNRQEARREGWLGLLRGWPNTDMKRTGDVRERTQTDFQAVLLG
jgi:hypothetical protein